MVKGPAYSLCEVVEALHDERVLRSLERALRDSRIRRRFRTLRRRLTVAASVALLAEAFCLSEERIRSIVYRKGM